MSARFVLFKQEPGEQKLIIDIWEIEGPLNDHLTKSGNFKAPFKNMFMEAVKKISDGTIHETNIYTMAIEHVDSDGI